MRLRPAYVRNRELVDELVALFTDSVRGMQTIKGFAAEKHQFARFESANRMVSQQQNRIFLNISLFTPATHVLSQLSLVILFSYGGWMFVHGRIQLGSGLVVFAGCAAMCAVTLALPYLPKGLPLLAVLLVAGAGALGVFPIYHAFTQDLPGSHQGKVTGVAGIAAWGFSPLAQKLFGRLVDRTHSFDTGLAVLGVLPLIALLCLIFFWGKSTSNSA